MITMMRMRTVTGSITMSITKRIFMNRWRMKDFANVDVDSDDDGDDDDNDYDDFDVDGGDIDENCAERPKPPRFLRLCFYFPHKISDS